MINVIIMSMLKDAYMGGVNRRNQRSYERRAV